MSDSSAPEAVAFGVPRIGSRRWIAWKLVQLAYRICDVDYDEVLTVRVGGRTVATIEVSSNLYGNGVSSASVVDNSVAIYSSDSLDDYPLVGGYPRRLGGDA